MNTLIQDLRYALRMLRKAPGFSTVAVVTLALGIGANAVIFSVVNAVMLRPLPLLQPDRLMMVSHSYQRINLPRASVMPFALGYYRENLKSFSSIAAETMWRGPQNLVVAGESQRVKTVLVSSNFFSTLGVKPSLGRPFSPQEDQLGQNRVVILSNALWTQQFGGDPDITSKTLSLDGQTYSIVGVMPRGFEMPSGGELWTPLAFTPQEAKSTAEYLTVIARLKEGVSQQQAQAELAGVSAQLLRQFPPLEQVGFRVIAEPLSAVLQENLRPALLVLLAAVGCVLLIACANMANLLLARASARKSEIAVRLALGATRGRLMRQFLTESVVLSGLAGLLGLLLAFRGVEVLLRLVPIEIPHFMQVTVDARVVWFTFALSLLVGLLFGVFPAFRSAQQPVSQNLSLGGRNSSAGGHDRARNILVVAELGIALVVLTCAGLLLRSFVEIRQSDPGFRSSNALTGWVALRAESYNSPEKIAGFYQQLLQNLSALPQVRSVAIGSTLPLLGDWTQSFEVEANTSRVEPHAYFAAVSPQYFSTLGIAVLRGRAFSDTDRQGSPLVAIIDERAAKAYWPNENPVGKRLSLDREASTGAATNKLWCEVVGVVASVNHRSALADQSKGEVYLPFAQNPLRSMSVVLRSDGDAADLGAALRREVARLDSTQAVYDVLTMEHYVDRFISQPRFNMVLLTLFAGLALLLSAIGIYGLISYWVVQRTREMGIRMALGASRSSVMRLVLVQTLRIVVVGVFIGTVAAMIATRALSGLLYGVGNYDPVTFVVNAMILSAVAFLAGYIPAHRVTKVEPLAVLRHE